MSSGKLLDISYNSAMFSQVTDLADFFGSNLPESKTLKALYNAVKLTFGAVEGRIIVQCLEGDRVYKLIVLTNNIHKYPIGWLIYMPLLKRLDLYMTDSPHLPLIQWKNKKPVFKNYSELLDKAGLDKIFTNIVNVL